MIPSAEKDATLALAENVRAMLRLLTPDHLTPVGKRQIERVLDEHVARVLARVAAEEEAHADDNDRPHYRSRVIPPGEGNAEASPPG